MKFVPAYLLALLGLVLVARADPRVEPPFTDHAVLQRELPVPVWGSADPAEEITVSYGGEHAATTADPEGHWIVKLPALSVTRAGSDLVVRGRSEIVVHDVVVGDVWFCSGQSNMAFSLDKAQNAPAEIAAANFPLIRQFLVARAVADHPAQSVRGAWVPCSPETAAHFTATGYFFARSLQAAENIPIGLINCTWGGTAIESWLTPDALASEPEFAIVSTRWKETLANQPAAKAAYDKAIADWTKGDEAARQKGQTYSKRKPVPPPGPGHQYTPTGLYNAMVHPLARYALRGILWYQGENNTPRPTEYGKLFAAMITSWRRSFGQGDLPFYWVQLPNFRGSSSAPDPNWARLREAQTEALHLPATGQAITIDIGDAANLHPLNKQEVGRRLALLAEHNVFHRDVEDTGPTLKDVTPAAHQLRITFVHAKELKAGAGALKGFEVAGEDRKFFSAAATIEGDTVVAASPEVPTPVAVRYAWHNAPEATLFNEAGLPGVPFRSDNW